MNDYPNNYTCINSDGTSNQVTLSNNDLESTYPDAVLDIPLLNSDNNKIYATIVARESVIILKKADIRALITHNKVYIPYDITVTVSVNSYLLPCIT